MRNIPFLRDKAFIELEETDSTNSYVKQYLSKNKPKAEMVIMSHAQPQGRGQYGNVWLSEPHKNLTFSYLHLPKQLSPDNQFILNIKVSLAIFKALDKLIQPLKSKHELQIKWPNDIYLDKKKIGGILIENTIQGNQIDSCIIGIGINVLQTDFGHLSHKASSLKNILGLDIPVKTVLEGILAEFNIIMDSSENFMPDYCQNLLGYKIEREYIENEEKFRGIIEGIDSFGKLKIYHIRSEQTKSYWFKEVEFVL